MPALTLAPGIQARYECDLHALPASLREHFLLLDHDAAAQAFVAHALAHRHGVLRTSLYGALRALLSDYDAYGLLGMYAMHVLSTEQWRKLIGESSGPRRLLDVGAGSGGVTAQAAPLFTEVVVTEASPVLRRSLRARGYCVEACDLGETALPADQRFDVVSALNVLDRTLRPRTLLQHLRSALTDDGLLVVALPLPLAPHVHVGSGTSDPDEPLPRSRKTWEEGAASIWSEVLEPAGLSLQALCRMPYLCQGDQHRPLYLLDDALFVCRHA